ncbi:MAG TPA: hypothetical protein VGN42_11655 [Pirellulales bacterium]|nr:hypothetical protein [Pirellulales bacterium]
MEWPYFERGNEEGAANAVADRGRREKGEEFRNRRLGDEDVD